MEEPVGICESDHRKRLGSAQEACLLSAAACSLTSRTSDLRAAAGDFRRRKVRAPQGMVVGNAHRSFEQG